MLRAPRSLVALVLLAGCAGPTSRMGFDVFPRNDVGLDIGAAMYLHSPHNPHQVKDALLLLRDGVTTCDAQLVDDSPETWRIRWGDGNGRQGTLHISFLDEVNCVLEDRAKPLDDPGRVGHFTVRTPSGHKHGGGMDVLLEPDGTWSEYMLSLENHPVVDHIELDLSQ